GDRASQLDRIVAGLQRLARADRPQNAVRFDAALVIAEALGEVAKAAEVRVVIERGEWVTGDPDAFREVVAELIGNAVRHGGRPDLTVRVAVDAGAGGHHLIVADDGRGV